MNPLVTSLQESIHQRVIELLQEPLLVENPDGKIILVNKSFCHLTGYSESEFLAGSFLDMLVPAELKKEFTAKREACKPDEPCEFEAFILRKDQTVFSGLVKSTPLTDDYGHIIGRINSLTDITQSRQQLDNIIESGERLRFLMQSTSEGIIIHENGIITDVNDALIRMVGYTYEELVGKSVFMFTSPKEHESMRVLFRQKMPFHSEREIIDKNGKIHYTVINSKSLMYKGRDTRVLMVKDISELREKKIEEQRLSSITEATPFLVAMMDFTGLRYMNAPGRTMLGYSLDEDISHCKIHDLMTKRSAEFVLKEAIPLAIKEGIWEGQSMFKRKDGTEFPTSQIIIAHRDKSGSVDFFSSLALDITERIKADNVLKESQQRLRYFMEESLEAIIIHQQGIIIDFNTAAYKMFGYEAGELLGKEIVSLYDISFHRDIKNLIIKRSTVSEEWTGVKKNGTRFDIQVYSRTHTYKGKDVRIVSILDITERKKTERALRSSELLLNTAVEGTNVGIWEWNLVTNAVTFNHVKKKICGYTDQNSPQFFDEWAAIIHPEDRETVLENMRKHLYENSPIFQAVYRVLHSSGKWIFLESKGKLVRDEHKLPVRLVGTSVDITERYRMEDELRKSQAQLTALIEYREEAIWSVDSEMRVVNFNKQFAEVFRTLFGVELKKGALITDGLTEEIARKWTARYEICMKGESLKFVETFLLKEQEIFVEFTANPIRFDDDVIIGVSVLGRNITQQMQFQESLKEAKELAEEANRTKSQFLANISHEIRTPMNGIMGFTELLLQSRLNEKQKEYLEIVRYSANSLLHLINDLLDISKIESGKLSLINNEFDLHRLIREIIRSFKTKTDEQNLKIVSSIDKDIPKKLIGDEMRLQQIFINIIGNALKFSEKGKISVRIQITEQINEELILKAEVEDEGIGIPADKLEMIFEPFNQVGDRFSGKYGGTGLGLSITKSLVEMMGGEIGVESEPGKGSRFYFSVKLKLPA